MKYTKHQKQEIITEVLDILSEHIEDPRSELNYDNEYQLLVAVVLSARTTDIQVNKATDKFFGHIKTPEEMVALGEEGLREYIKTIGIYKTKATKVIKLSEILIEKYDSKVPKIFEQLIELPGVGRKTANVVLNALDIADTIAVDTHVARVSQRLGITSHTHPDKIEQDLMEAIPDRLKRDAHHLLILHGRYCCKARKPNCKECIVSHKCVYTR